MYTYLICRYGSIILKMFKKVSGGKLKRPMFVRSSVKAQPKRFAKAQPAFIKGSSLAKQVKALISGKRKDATDVLRTWNTEVTAISCLTSSTDFATAPAGSGLLGAESDNVLINSVRIGGNIRNTTESQGAVNSVAQNSAQKTVRILVVYFAKPLLVASSAGTLPPITEVLVTDAVDSLPIQSTRNAGRFTILSDRRFNVGINVTSSTTAGFTSGKTNHALDYFVKVNKKCHFFVPPSPASTEQGGHYDSDINTGRVDKGLLCMYILATADTPVTGILIGDLSTRLNFTG